MAWTKFSDMYSGGSCKTKYNDIYIELPEYETKQYFENEFGRDPYNVTCNCCGNDFVVYEVDEPEQGKYNLIIDNHKIKNP